MNGLALFAGVGGLELGIKQLIPSSRIICYVEGEAFSSSVLVSKMEEGILHEAPIWSDVRTFNGSIFSGKVDFISAGFPCQPWSVAGKQKGIEDERWLWDDIERIICDVRPNFVFLENVSNFINGGIDAVLGTLAKFGFNAEYGCLKVSEVGGNHHRNRFFLFAYSAEGGRIMADTNGFRSPESGEICQRSNGKEFECDGEKGGIIQYSNRFRRTQLHAPSIPSELGFITRGYDTPWGSKAWWSVEPSICRVVDGVADRVDRLRACGNGVVPYQAYRAYSELIERAIKRRHLIDP